MEQEAVQALLPAVWRYGLYIALSFVSIVLGTWQATEGNYLVTAITVASALQGWFAARHVSRDDEGIPSASLLERIPDAELRAELAAREVS